MNDDLMLDYLMGMGAMRPEDDRLKRKQQMIDMLRENAMNTPSGSMAGQVYVPNIGGALGNLGAAALGGMQQKRVDAGVQSQNARQAAMLEALRRKKQQFPEDYSPNEM